MKKKYIIIILTIIVLIILGILTYKKDKSRINNNEEPKYVLRLVSSDGSKITYIGLGYKIIRYVGISPNEPFKNNVGVKIGSWFMKYKLADDIISYDELKSIKKEIENKLEEYMKNNTYTNFSSIGINEVKNKIIIELVDNSEEEQNWFRENIYNSKYILFEQGGPYTTLNSKIQVVKSIMQDTNKFSKYLEKEEKTIYLSSSLDDVYYILNNKVITLKDYLSNTYQTLDDGMEKVISIVEYFDSLNDGGTKIFKSKNYDITIIKCNTLSKNYDYYIGDYNLQYNEFMYKGEKND